MTARRNSLSPVLRLSAVWWGMIWWVVPLGRLGCWNSQVILEARFRTARGWGERLSALGPGLTFPFVCYGRTLRTLNRLAERPGGPNGSHLEQVREILSRATPSQRREETKGEQRDVQKVCVRTLYKQILRSEPDERTLHVLSLYQYAGDAMGDLLDFCRAQNAMHSRTSVLRCVNEFIGALIEYRRQSAEKMREGGSVASPNGHLPPRGYFTSEQVRDAGRKGPVKCLIASYWQYEHGERLIDPDRNAPRQSWQQEFGDGTRAKMGGESLRAMLCHEMVVQGAKELLQACSARRFANRDERLKQWLSQISAGGERFGRS